MRVTDLMVSPIDNEDEHRLLGTIYRDEDDDLIREICEAVMNNSYSHCAGIGRNATNEEMQLYLAKYT